MYCVPHAKLVISVFIVMCRFLLEFRRRGLVSRRCVVFAGQSFQRRMLIYLASSPTGLHSASATVSILWRMYQQHFLLNTKVLIAMVCIIRLMPLLASNEWHEGRRSLLFCFVVSCYLVVWLRVQPHHPRSSRGRARR